MDETPQPKAALAHIVRPDRRLARCVAAVLQVLALAWPVGVQARSSPAPAIPLKTGNLSITSYRAPLMKGEKPEPLDPMLAKPDALREMGMTWVEDYVTFDVAEPAKGRADFAPYVANARACRRHRLNYAIYPWGHFYADWVEKEPGFTPYTSLEDGSTCRQPSGWAPATTKLVEQFYELMGRRLGKSVKAVYVTDCAEYGELGYPNGYTKWLRKDDNAKVAWWCGDPYARADFRVEQLKQWGTLEAINERWGTKFESVDRIDYPPIDLLRSNPDPRKLEPRQRRRILDFVYWYQNASPRRMKTFIRIAQEAFPDRPCEVKLGHADERAIMGQSYSSACRILRRTPRLAIRSTHAAVSYFHVKRVATPARYYEFEGFLTEPPGTVKPERMAERIFTDACCGVSAYFDYPQNPPAAGEAFMANIGLLDGKPALVDVALLFPEADHYLRIDQPYPAGLIECAGAIRDVADFDVIDERLIADGILERYAVVVIVGDPLVEEMTSTRLRDAIRRGHKPTVIQVVDKAPATPVGRLMCVDGEERPLGRPEGLPDDGRLSPAPRPSEEASPAPSVTVEGGGVIRVVGSYTGDKVVAAVQQAYADLLGRRGLDKEQITLLTARDGVWTGLFEHRILAYNTADKEKTVHGKALAARHIMAIKR